MARWEGLPAEVRSMILDIVIKYDMFRTEPYARAGYASVCREWQLVFEPKNFQRIVLDQDRISDLEQYLCQEGTRYRQKYLHRLVLRVKLDEYDCTVCQSKEDYKTVRRNNYIFSKAVWNLLIILSNWTGVANVTCGGDRHQEGLILELSAYSPSDSKHTFRDFHLEHDYPYQEIRDLESKYDAYRHRADTLGLDSLNDLYHGWVDGRQKDLCLESKQRVMGTLTIRPNLPEFSAFRKRFPKIEIVTGLVIRRQYYRKIATSSLSKLFRESFTCLEWFRHEGWHHVSPEQQSCFEKEYRSLISQKLPSTLRRLHIFEDFNKIVYPKRSTQTENPSLGRALSKSSRSLEDLSASFLVDAKDFFSDFSPTKIHPLNVIPWENLRTVALTSRLLHPRIGCQRIDNLLIAAGRAAAFMPKLEIMEIWNGGGNHACIFRYEYSDDTGQPQISWDSNWDTQLPLHYSVVCCWANLPRLGQEYPRRNLIAVVRPILRRNGKRMRVKTYIGTVCHLKLRMSTMDTISRYQLCWEEIQLKKR